jgi:cation diffusion facilitator CzcD-associated flavoprotein CzcO
MSEQQVAVVGAGPAGVSVAVALKDRGVTPTLVDRADQVGASWRGRYDRLTLNTGRQFSHLPARRYPSGTPTYPTRDQVVALLDRHGHEDGIQLRLSTAVQRIEPEGDGWTLHTTTGAIHARQVVVATGYDHTPFIPDWPGRNRFTEELRHASQYRNPAPYSGRRVLVVGSGCSGMEIAYDLAAGGAAKVWLAVRTPPNIMIRQGPAGLPGDVIATPLYHLPIRLADAIARFGRRVNVGDLSEYGLPVPGEGVFARSARLGVAPAIVDREVIEAIKRGNVEIVAGVESLGAEHVALADGTRVSPAAVICATGYRRGLVPLVGHLGVLDETGRPRVHGEPAAPGLRFIGFIPRPTQIGYAAKQARRAARDIARELRR